MGLDMPPGSGWRLGGPSVPREDASASLHIEADTVRGVYVADALPLGDKVKRPAPGGEGYAIDPFSRLAVRHYLDAYGRWPPAAPQGTHPPLLPRPLQGQGDRDGGLLHV